MQITDLVPLCRARVMKMAGPNWDISALGTTWEAIPPSFPLKLQSVPAPTISNLVYDNTPPITQPKILATSTYNNGTDAQDTQTFTDAKQTTASASWTVTHGITLGTSVTLSANFLPMLVPIFP
jgi:hypothetical protein